MSGWLIRAIGIGIALLLTLAAIFGIRCMSLTSASCSLESLFGTAPELDVPYAETRHDLVAAMHELAGTGAGDYVIDLGTGDGRLAIAAVRDHGAARALGVDIDPVLVREAEGNARAAEVADRVVFRTEDLFDTPIGEADVLTMFLLPEVNLRLRPRILEEMRPGARVVSHAFDMAEWRPDDEIRVGGDRAYLWIVPAQVDGRWEMTMAGGGTAILDFDQSFQFFTGTAQRGGDGVYLGEGRLRGPALSFTADLGAGERRYRGAVDGDVIAGEDGWRATRIEELP